MHFIAKLHLHRVDHMQPSTEFNIVQKILVGVLMNLGDVGYLQ